MAGECSQIVDLLAQLARYYPNFNIQITPNFLKGRAQFTSEEVLSDWRICQLRYTSEVAFSRVTNEKGGTVYIHE